MYQFDPMKKPRKLSLFLAKPNRATIGKIKDSSELKQTLKRGNINELSFSIPFYISKNHELIKNPIVDKIKERFLIKAKYGDEIEWYIITKKTKSNQDGANKITIECFSLGYELKYKRLKGYSAISYNCTQVLGDCLNGTRWTIGYVNPSFNLEYRQFDASSNTRLDFLLTIATTFNATIVFDTINRKINMYKLEELEVDFGLRFTHRKYTQSLNQTIDIDEVCTRLHMYGANDMSVQGINPTGQDYVDDFSYYLYPFQRDGNKNVISHSDYMSDELCHAILDYNFLLNNKFTDLNDLLTQKSIKQTLLTGLQNELNALQSDFTIILDDIEIAKDNGENLNSLYTQKSAKQSEINNKNNQIKSKQGEIDTIDRLIRGIGTELKLENNFNSSLLNELNDYIMEQEFSDGTIVYDSDLYNVGMEHHKKINTPPVSVSMSIIDFRNIIEEQHNWDKLMLNSIVRINHEQLNVTIKTSIDMLTIDYDAGTISLNITNNKLVETLEEKFIKNFYNLQKTTNKHSKQMIDLRSVAQNFNLRNDRISAKPANPTVKSGAVTHTVNDNGSVNLKFVWEFANTNDDAHNIDGFLLRFYSSNLSDSYTFGSSKETIVSVEQGLRSYVFPSVPSNLYYTLAVQAYRSVDADINNDGYLLSDIITTGNPYQPLPVVNVKGKVNSILYTTSPTPPENPSVGEHVWNDIAENKTKIYTETGWQTTNAANSDTVAGFGVAVENAPNTIAVRDDNGAIDANINGDAKTFDGKSIDEFVLQSEKGVADGVATLDDEGGIPLIQLSNIASQIPQMKFANYIGDGTQSRTFNLGFQPTIVKIYTTDKDDNSVYINSTSGGFAMKHVNTFLYLDGSSANLNEQTSIYGKLSTTGFITGDSTDFYANKINVEYFYEAIKIPPVTP
ncbi:hypothetical protein COE51_16330 [Bacillus pseudomycoides]|nr:hypothetical protein COE51_16330 [Bacillus pseudomycoides]